MMNEKNNKEIAAVIAQWLGKTLPGRSRTSVPFPTFVSSRSTRFTNVGNKGTLASHDPSVALHLTFL